MSKKQFKSQASSSRAVSGVYGTSDTPFGGSGLGTPSAFGAVSFSPLSYVYEPPDLSGISLPNVVVAFKNVQKKDSTTKAKALEDLQNHVLSLKAEKGGVEEAIVEAWIKIYPRTSIDSARRVRQLAHLLQGQLSVFCGKRIAKHMPKIVGPWLAGLYDNDKVVSRAAQESLKQVFNTEDKMKNIWTVYQKAILDYSKDVIMKETINTLSDERTTSPDDASAKYTRVVGAALLVISYTINENPPDILQKQHSMLSDFLSQEKVWNHASSPDPAVRRSVYRLLVAALAKQKNALDINLISPNVLTSSLHINQAGSAFDYARALALLTVEFPEAWTRYYSGSLKKSATKRLCQFLRKGSQAGPPQYWLHVSILLRHIPREVLLAKLDGEPGIAEGDSAGPSLAILEALHDGLMSKDEPRPNHCEAWKTYLDTSAHLQFIMQHSGERAQMHKTGVLPLIVQYIKPSQENSSWTVPASQQLATCSQAFEQIARGALHLLEEEWYHLSAMIIDDIRTSLPEQSKDYTKSQIALSEEASRWYDLQAFIAKGDAVEFIKLLFDKTLLTELQAAVDILRTRNGKPYSAASMLESAIRLLPDFVLSRPDTRKLVVEFVLNDIPEWITSPSAPHCIDILNHLEGILDVRQTYHDAIVKLREAPKSTAKSSALQCLISSSFLDQTEEADLLGSIVQQSLKQVMTNETKDWAPVMAAMGNPVAPAALTDSLLTSMAQSLSIDEKRSAGLHGLELATKLSGRAVKSFALSQNGSALISKLLSLSESPDDDVSRQAKDLTVAIEAILSEENGSGYATRSMIEIINKGIDVAGADSLSIESLASQACKVWDQVSGDDKSSVAAELLPDAAQFVAVLGPFLQIPPNISLSITNSLGGAIHLIDQPLATESIKSTTMRDVDGYSPTLRMVWYTTKLIKETNILSFLAYEKQAVLWNGVSLFLQLAGDNISVPGSNDIWNHYARYLEVEILDLITEAQTLLQSWLRDALQEKADSNWMAQRQLLEESRGSSAASYYSARAYSAISTDLRELHGHTPLDDEAERLRTMRKSRDVFASAAYLASASDYKALLRLCNELVSDLTSNNFNGEGIDGLRQLVLLNCITQNHEDVISDIPQQRLVFFVKHIDDVFREVKPSYPIRTELFKALAAILPPIKGIYESFWLTLIKSAQNALSVARVPSDEELPSLHASCRLIMTLHRLSIQESNDDLVDAWNESKESIADSLLSLLSQLQSPSDESHQPRKIVNELLARLIAKIPPSSSKETADLYSVLASESVVLQTVAFEMLHQRIPARQEQISFDKALTRDFSTQLPEELLSLVLAAPSLDSLAEASFERTMPPSLRSYLLSWQLVFDHWTNSSFKVQADYAASLKEGTYLHDLLELTFDILINARTKPIDASKFDIDSYTPNVEESPEKETHWLLTHLYYLSLKHLTNLTRTWWRDSTSRQTMLAVESWTEKHISPLITASELSTISTWAPSQATADAPLTVKVSPSIREITASIPVDEQLMQIAIRLPPTYPLARASVEGVHRVGVDEKRWRSWLITTQGVVNFSTADSGEGGNLIDGLLAWRKNVTATMKGQTECAICYSVVGTDGQLPSKRCGTCRNLFHGSCLFRWFKSSNSSSCPLCRNAFNYG